MMFQFKFEFVDERGYYTLTVTPTSYSTLSNRPLAEAEKMELLSAAEKFEGVAKYLRKVGIR
jgi:hypothetical protein